MKIKNVIKAWMVVSTVVTVGWSLWCLKQDISEVNKRFE